MEGKKKTKLKKMKISSVDMCQHGANQDAHINLKKSERASPEELVHTEEIPQGLWKSIVDTVKEFFGIEENFEKADDGEDVQEVDIQKSRDEYIQALGESIDSIMNDGELDDIGKSEMIEKSIDQFSDAYKELCALMLNASQNITKATENTVPDDDDEVSEPIPPEGDRDMKIDKSRFTEEELNQYEALIAKGKVDDEEFEKEDDELEVEKEDATPGKVHPAKAQEEEEDNVPPEVKKALEEVQELRKSLEMQSLTEFAKKYECLGKKAPDTAKTLYDLKKTSESNYNAYVALLDEQVSMVEKSGMFTEIGKSGNFNYTSVAKSEPESKIESIAKNYMEKDPTMTYDEAVAKAWGNNPELFMAYEQGAGF